MPNILPSAILKELEHGTVSLKAKIVDSLSDSPRQSLMAGAQLKLVAINQVKLNELRKW